MKSPRNRVKSTQRQDVRQSLSEAFTYDNLYRLDYSTLNGTTNLDLTYDALGNITYKSDVGSYTYHGTKKHAVTAAGSLSFAYDANGNASTRNGSSISWYSYNLPNTISASGSNSSQFFYAPDRSRWKQVASYAGTTETTIYIGGLIEKVTLGSVTSWKHYISGASGPVAVYTRKSGAADEMHYLTRDHLGSVDSVTTGLGAIEVRLSFASFGQRRKEAGWSGNPTSGDWTEITDSTRRGFTTHEMLDNLSLIHMNGRVYDPVVGRFLSADPLVAKQQSTQDFNRFAYVRNNPLSLIDPSGFRDKETRVQLIDRDPGTFYELSQNIAFRNQFFAGGSASGLTGGSLNERTFCGMACRGTAMLGGFTGANGAVLVTGVNSPIQQFGGQLLQWVPGGTVSAGEVGPGGEAVDDSPAQSNGRWIPIRPSARNSFDNPREYTTNWTESYLQTLKERASATATGAAAWGIGGQLDITVDGQTLDDGTVEIRPAVDVGYGLRLSGMLDWKVASSGESLRGPLMTNLTVFAGGGLAGGFNVAIDYHGNWDITISGGYGWGAFYGSVAPISGVTRMPIAHPAGPWPQTGGN